MVGISQLSQMLKPLHSDTNDGHALNSLHGILQTTFSKFNAILRLRIAKIISLIKNGHALNSHLEIIQTTSSEQYVLLGKALMVGISQLSQMLKSLHSDTNDGHALNSLHGILQTTISKLNALLRLRIDSSNMETQK